MATDPRIGTVLAGYRIDGPLGKGGMGVVYRAEHMHLQRPVALKLLAPNIAEDQAFRERFMRESRLAASIQHPHIVTVYDAGEVDGLLYIAMQLVEGTDLSALLSRRGRLDPAHALSVVGQVGSALDAAHGHGLVHRDVKPGNVLIAPETSYLTDFGLTKRTSSSSAFTQTGQFVGTIDYIAPEQIRGESLDGRADIYSLGCVLYECLTGDRPFPRDSQIAVIYAHLEEPPPRVSATVADLPAEVDDVISMAMAKSPDDRPASCAALLDAARAAIGHTQAGAARLAEPLPRGLGAAEAASTQAGGEGTTRGADAGATRARAVPPTRPDAAEADTRALPPDPPTAHGAAPLPPRGAPAPPPPSRRSGGRRGLVAAGLAALAAVAVGVLLAGGGDDPAEERATGGETATEPAGATTPEPPPAPPRRGARVEVGEEPFGVVARDGRVWVSNMADGTISVLDAGTRRPLRDPIRVGGTITGISAGGEALWVADTENDTVRPVDLASFEPGAPIPVGQDPYWLALGAGDSLWVSNAGADSVTRINTRSRSVVDTIDVGSEPRGIATTPSSVWVGNHGDDTLTKLDVGTGRVLLQDIPVGDAPRGMAIKDGRIWVANSGDGTVSRLSNSSGDPLSEPIAVGGKPFSVWAGDRYVWVTDEENGTVTRIDPQSGRIVGEPIRVGDSATGVRADAGAVWIADPQGGFVVKLNE